jgi:hypothetical protein
LTRERLNPDFLRKCVDLLKSNVNNKSETVIRALKSLLIHGQRGLADELVERVVLQDPLEAHEQEFLKIEFNIDFNFSSR